MASKKGKHGRKIKSNKAAAASPSVASEQQPEEQKGDDAQQQLQQDVDAAWNRLQYKQQAELMTFDLQLLVARACYAPGQSELQEALAKGIDRLRHTGKMRIWKWQPEQLTKTFSSPKLFKRSVEHHKLPKSAQDCLECLRGRPHIVRARQDLHSRIKAIQQKVAEHKQAQAVLKRTKPWRLSRQSLLIDVVFTQMLSGHEFLYYAFAAPIQQAVWEVLPKDMRSAQPPSEDEGSLLDFVLIDVAGKDTIDATGQEDEAHVAQISKWVEEKLAAFCRLTQPAYDVEAEEVAPLTLSAVEAGSSTPATLSVSEHWLQHQDKQLKGLASGATESASDSTARMASTPAFASADVVTDWIYSAVPLMSCSARLPGSKTAPAPAACDLLIKTIQDVDAAGDALYQLEGLIGVMKDELLEQQQSGSVLDLRDRYKGQLPPATIVHVLNHEFSVVKANVCIAGYKTYLGSMRLFRVGQRLSQAEARYRHLKILEQAMERHGASLLYFDPNSSDHQRAHVGKAMLDEQSLNTAALLDVNNSVQALKREREAAEQDQEKLALELHKATVWGDEIAQMVASLADFSNTSDSFAMAHGMRAVRLSEASLNKLSDHFHKGILPKLCTTEQLATLIRTLQTQQALMARHFEDGCAVMEVLRAQVVDAACEDPAEQILPQLVVPLLRERLEAKAKDFQAGKLQSCTVDPGNKPGWDPTFDASIRYYQQCIGRNDNIVLDDDQSWILEAWGDLVHVLRLGDNVEGEEETEDDVCMFASYVDDLLLRQFNFARPELLLRTILAAPNPNKSYMAAVFLRP